MLVTGYGELISTFRSVTSGRDDRFRTGRVGCWPVDFVSSAHVLVIAIIQSLNSEKKKKEREEECVSSFSQLGDVFLLLNENTTK